MRTSRYFLPAVLAGFLIATLGYFCLVYWRLGAQTPNSFWCFDLHRRKLAAAESISKPKLLIVGGSGALFGIKARRIQEKTGIPTVNLSSHAALGPAYIMRLAQKAARPGDTVLLVLEYELYTHGTDNLSEWADSIYVDFLMARDTDYFLSLPVKDQMKLSMILPLKDLWTGLRAKWSPPPNEGRKEFSGYWVYDARHVDDLGDLCGHIANRRPAVLKKFATSQELAKGVSSEAPGFADIARFCEWARQHNVHVLATFPNIAHMSEYDRPECAQGTAKLCHFYATQSVAVVGMPQDYIMPKDLFFDTCYHLTEEAACDRTDRLIAQLTPFLAASQKGNSR